MKKYGVSVDIGGTTCKIGLFYMDATLIEKWEIPTNTENEGKGILIDIKAAICAKLKENRIGIDELQGVGLGVPGPVGADGTVYKCVNLGWGVINVEKELSEMLGVPVKAGNDANVAALGELWKGAAKGCLSAVMVTLGTGVGGGIIMNGKIVSGIHGAGGEIGHLKMQNEEPYSCGCGKQGCLEQYASATGIVRAAEIKLENYNRPTCLKEIKPLTAKDIFNAAKCGDMLALELVDELYEKLGTAIANMACLIDPEIFIIGGGLSKAGSVLLEEIKKYYKKKAFHACESTKIVLATLGNDAGMYGSLRLLF